MENKMIDQNLLPGERIVKAGEFKEDGSRPLRAILGGLLAGVGAFFLVLVGTFDFKHVETGLSILSGIIMGVIVMMIILRKSVRNDEFAITNKRVLAYTLPRVGYNAQTGVFSKSSYMLTSLEISKVETISITDDGINVVGTGGTMLYATGLTNAMELKNYLQHVVDECKMKIDTTNSSVAFVNPTTISQSSSETTKEKLQALKSLLDDGLITVQEFEEKKKQILDSL